MLSKDQPWTIRREQEWKAKVYGQAQQTGPGHDIRSYREAISAAKQVDTERVHLDHGYKRVTGEEVYPNRRPDVSVVKRDGTVHAVEVISRTDKPEILRTRNEVAMAQLPENRQGSIRVVEVTKTEKKVA